MKSAVFFMRSPFQLLCAYNAISYYKIEKYKFYIVRGNDDRYRQIVQLADLYGLSYQIVFPNEICNNSFIKILFDVIRRAGEKYDYVFAGDYRDLDYNFSYLSYVRFGGKYCFVDDGNFTILLLKNAFIKTRVFLIKEFVFKIMSWIKFVKLVHYTIFTGLPNKKFNIEENTLFQPISFSANNRIYVIGTNPSEFCKARGIELESLYSCMSKLADYITTRNPGIRVSYIPHGRDFSEQTKEMCVSNNWEYTPISTCIENYFLALGIKPYAIMGFGSTALYSLKKMQSDIEVTNVIILRNKMISTVDLIINDYYRTNGIKSIEI